MQIFFNIRIKKCPQFVNNAVRKMHKKFVKYAYTVDFIYNEKRLEAFERACGSLTAKAGKFSEKNPNLNSLRQQHTRISNITSYFREKIYEISGAIFFSAFFTAAVRRI